MNPLSHLSLPIMSLAECRNDAERQVCNMFISMAAEKAEKYQKLLDRRYPNET